MDERSIKFPDKDVPLRNDVNTLGAIVGDVLIEQFGREVFDRVEALRTAAITRRETGSADLDSLAQQTTGIELEQARNLIQGFSGYFQVVNLAERVHRIRRVRDYQREGKAPSESLRQKLAELKAAGIDAAAISDLIADLVIEPVMTAHPTEATRRTLLIKERAIATQLVQRFDDGRTPQEERSALDRIREQITIGWQTRPYSATKTTVDAEREHVLFYISDILYEVVPVFYEALRTALDESYPDVFADAPLPRVLGFGSWVGGDMDGNPNVDHRTLAASLAEHRRLIIQRYIAETRALADTLTQSISEVGVSTAVRNRVDEYEQRMPAAAARIEDRLADMPYRNLLVFMRARLRAVLTDDEQAYASCDEFLNDVRMIRESLAGNRGSNAGMFKIERLIWRIRTFGFYLATLDVRQDSADLRAAVANLLDDADWEARPVEERIATLTAQLQQAPAAPGKPGPQLERALAVLNTIDTSQRTYGAAAIGSFIISMAQGADDVLSVLLLAQAAGLGEAGNHVPLDVAPLLETVDDLQRGESILRQLAAIEPYRQHLENRDNRQLIMVGYSDSNKDGGIASARWALQQAQRQMSMTATELGIRLGFFHGRGGSVSRGGGNMVRGIYAAPVNSVGGYMRITEQGEVIHQKYGIRPLALRNLEQITGATIAASLKAPLEDGDQWAAIMTTIADASRARYRALVYDTPEFPEYFRQATPIDVIERLQIGSRPAARRSKLGIQNLRAIPWVFSRAQTRIGLPGTFGVGSGLAHAIEQHGIDALRDMLAWPFFSGLINDVEMVLAKSDLDIGSRYNELADAHLRGLHEQIAAELELTKTLLLDIKQAGELLEEDPTLQRAIRLRNPYVDPLNLLQVQLLKEWRATDRKDDAILAALFDTINGIARGVQNTG